MVNKPPKTSVTSKTAVFPLGTLKFDVFVFVGFLVFFFEGNHQSQTTENNPQKKLWGSIWHMFLSGSHSVMWRAHCRIYSLLVSGKHFLKVPVLGKRTRGSWPRNTSASGAGNTSKSWSPWNSWQNPPQGQGPLWAIFRTSSGSW